MDSRRKIIHVDMDAFYAAVEQRDFPAYRNKPLIVGGSPFSRGVVATCSYEARKFGIHSAMPSSRAYRLCPDAIFVKPRFEVYKAVSEEIRRIFFEFTDLVEPLSLDEAYLDVTGSNSYDGSASMIAMAIKSLIKSRTQLTASAGVSYNKFLAKIASDINKPDGLCVITPDRGEPFIEQLAVSKIHGIGKATAKKMADLHIHTGIDLKAATLPVLQQHFGKAGQYYYNIARGIDSRLVVSFRESKSIGTETTFQTDILAVDSVIAELEKLFDKAMNRVKDKKLWPRTITVKIKYYDFVQITRSRSVEAVGENALKAIIPGLLTETAVGKQPVRLLGIAFSNLRPSSVRVGQIDLFEGG
jgi:DNA polymerase IV